jgi:WD40 repeat protein
MVKAIVFSPDDQWIASASEDGLMKIWEPMSGKQRLTFHGPLSIWSMAFSPDGRRIVTGSADRTAKLWDAASGKELLTFRGHTGWVFAAAFSPDG